MVRLHMRSRVRGKGQTSPELVEPLCTFPACFLRLVVRRDHVLKVPYRVLREDRVFTTREKALSVKASH
jgi:hypothetical protein